MEFIFMQGEGVKGADQETDDKEMETVLNDKTAEMRMVFNQALDRDMHTPLPNVPYT